MCAAREARACLDGKKDAALPHARRNKRPQLSQANPSLDRTDDGESAVINLIDAQYLLYAVAKKYRFLSNATLVQQPSEDGASDDIVVRVRVMRPETTGMMVATLVDVDVLMELSSSALIGTELSFSAGGPAAAERSGVLGACRTMLPANLVRHVIMPPGPSPRPSPPQSLGRGDVALAVSSCPRTGRMRTFRRE